MKKQAKKTGSPYAAIFAKELAKLLPLVKQGAKDRLAHAKALRRRGPCKVYFMDMDRRKP